MNRSRKSGSMIRRVTDFVTFRKAERARGTAVVEFAVVAPLLFLLLFGIIEFGQIYKVRLTAQQAAREGCRIAVLQSTAKPYNSSSGPVMQRIEEIMTAGGVDFTSGMVTIEEDSAQDPTVAVTITVPYEEVKLTGFLHLLTEELHGQCSMRKEGV